MSRLLFENARLIDPETGSDAPGWLLVENGRIAAKGEAATPEADKRVTCNGACLAPGLVDIGAHPGPGEGPSSLAASAAAGGVTTLAAYCGVQIAPVTAPVHILPIADLTQDRAGRAISPLARLTSAGAIAFGDGPQPVDDRLLLEQALQAAKDQGTLVIGHPQDATLSAKGVATAGKFATLRGLPAILPEAEQIGLARDLDLVAKTGAAYHADQITTARALPLLDHGRAQGADITAGTSIHHLSFNEMDIAAYRPTFKFTPPLRQEEDRQALIDAVRHGVIDVISSLHLPQPTEHKDLPFALAASGAVALETLLPAALRLYHSGDLSLPQLWCAMSLNPARRLGLPCGRLSPGAPADLVLFTPDTPFIQRADTLRSVCKNTPFDGARMQGKVRATYCSGSLIYEAP